MVGIFNIYAIGVQPVKGDVEKQKKPKWGYTFVNGYKKDEDKDSLIRNATCVTCWLERPLNIKFMEKLEGELDVQAMKDGGQFCRLLSFTTSEGEQIIVDGNNSQFSED